VTPRPPLNTLGYVLADPATALPLLEGGRVLVFSSDAEAKRYRDNNVGAGVRHARVIAVAMVPLMLAGEAPVGEVAVVVDVRGAVDVAMQYAHKVLDDGRKRRRPKRLEP